MSGIEELSCDALRYVIWRRKHFLYAVESRPDKKNRNSKDIDFVLDCQGRPKVAVEHTSIESFEDQRKTGSRHADFTKKVSQLVQVPQDSYYKLACPAEMYIELSKRERDDLVPQVAALVSQNLRLLRPHGRSNPFQILSGRFTLWIGKGGDYQEFNGKLLAALIAPKGLEEGRGARISRALFEKLPKLVPYAKQGMLTYLVLEDWDIGISNSMLVKNVLLKMKRKYSDQLPYGILQLTSYRDRIVEAWLVKEGSRWSSRISNRGPFYDFLLPVNHDAD